MSRAPTTDFMLKALIMDSLITRSGRSLTPDLIQEITAELLARLIETIEEEKN